MPKCECGSWHNRIDRDFHSPASGDYVVLYECYACGNTVETINGVRTPDEWYWMGWPEETP